MMPVDPGRLPFLLCLCFCSIALTCCNADMSLPESPDVPLVPCPGAECADDAPLGWQGPVWLWSGAEAEAPPCPEDTSVPVYEGHADLRSSGSCDACACTTPDCGFPEGVRISAGPDCVGEFVDILVPPNWDGSCFSFPPVEDPISVFFQKSTRSDCVPIVSQMDKHVDFSWDTFARACTPTAVAESCSAVPTQVCATPPPEGFAQCLFREGESSTCPTDYPELRRFHGAVDDQSSCTPCSCQLPEASNCRVFMSLDMTSFCKFGGQGTVVDPAHEGCLTNYGPSQYASLRGEIKETEPDVCLAGGGAFVGEVLPVQPTTFCCKAE